MDSALIATNAATTTVLNGTSGNLEQVCIAAFREMYVLMNMAAMLK
jgi:hypothetical protein